MDWKRGPIIGQGSSAAVSLATNAAGGLFAVKYTDLSSSSLLQREQYLISQLCSPFIVKCLGFDTTCENNRPVYNLFLEYVSGGSLFDQIARQGGSLDEGLIQFYAHQMLQGLNYLHLNGFVHCDIKGQNILIGEDGLKIADFGCANWIGSEVSSKSMFAGTPAYMAPEVARGEEQSFPADIWALGCTIIEMATGSNAWPEMKDPASALYRIAYSDDVPQFPSWFSDNAKDFLSKCLTRDFKKRWTAGELLNHAFFLDVGENCGEIREFTRKSPTSVMDQDFWGALEVSGSSQNSVDIASTSDSPADRIRDLIRDGFPSNLSLPDWIEENDWVTVRVNIGIEECSKSANHDYQDFIVAETVMFSGVSDQESQTSIAVEDSSFDYFNDVISIINSNSTIPFTFTENAKDVSVSELIMFDRILMEFFSHMNQFILQSFLITYYGFFSFCLRAHSVYYYSLYMEREYQTSISVAGQ